MPHHRSYYSGHRSYYKKPLRRSKGFYIFLGFLIIVALFIYWSIQKADQPPGNNQKFTDQEKAPQLSARVTYRLGQIQTKGSERTWAELKENQTLVAGDAVRTAKASRLVLELPDKSLIRLAENSEIKFDQLGLADIVVQQISGTAFHRINDQSTAIYRVLNQQTELTALGTSFNVLASGPLTYLTVTENRVKVKIYNGEDVINMRTIETGTRASINTTLSPDKLIQTESVLPSELLNEEWYAWNLAQDQEQKAPLGIFEKSLKLIVTEPSQSELTTAAEKIDLKGETDPGALIFIGGQSINNQKGQFTSTLPLNPGENKIEITVTKDGNQNKKTLTITSTKQKIDLALTGKINLTAEIKDGNINLIWTLGADLIATEGFKSIISQTANPVYPGNSYHSITANQRNDIWQNLSPGAYHLRLCLLKNGQCSLYSNDALVTIKNTVALNLTGRAGSNQINLNWTLSNLDTPQGFKVIMSEKPNVIFPGQGHHLILSATAREDLWVGLTAGKTYYFRVCQNLASGCGAYSNEVALTFIQ